MGYEYYFLRPDNKTAFELGKDRTGFPYVLKNWKKIPKKLLNNSRDLAEILLQAAQEWGSWAPDCLNIESMQEIADAICLWAEGKPVVLVGEGELDLPDIETDNAARAAGKWVRQYIGDGALYTLTGTRYVKDRGESNDLDS